MEKADLTDVTFLIPLRIDSIDRLNNINLVIEYLKRKFITKIIVLETDIEEHFKNNPYVDKKIFVKDKNPIFHHTMYRNFLSNCADSKIIAVWDADILLHYGQILEAINLIRRNKTNFVLPYDGRVFKIDPILKSLYLTHKDLSIILQNQKKMNLMYGHFSAGGVYFVKRNSYRMATVENEKFYGWGPEDMERVKRWEILGYNVEKINGPLYHLHHQRKKNSWYSSCGTEKRNRFEFIRICRMSKMELSTYFVNQAFESKI